MDKKEKLIGLLGKCPCENDCEEEVGACPQRKHGNCGEVYRLPHCALSQMADNLVAGGVTVQEWFPVEDERKPRDRRRYFIAFVFGDSNMHFFGEAMYHAHEGNGLVDRPHFSNEGVDEMRVTHWMEIPRLPNPVKEEKNEDS